MQKNNSEKNPCSSAVKTQKNFPFLRKMTGVLRQNFVVVLTFWLILFSVNHGSFSIQKINAETLFCSKTADENALSLGEKNNNNAPSLFDIISPDAVAEVLGEGYGFCEGPASDAQGNVWFSDGNKDNIHVYKQGQKVAVFVDKNDSLDANGMMFDKNGQLIVCEGAAFRISSFDPQTKEKTILIDKAPDAPRFNEPNDLTLDAENGIYFTDPNYKHRRQESVMDEAFYYAPPQTNQAIRMKSSVKNPNGILLSADGSQLFVGDCSAQKIYQYDVVAPGKLEHETLFCEVGAHPDGMTLDKNGNLYVGCGAQGIRVFCPNGQLLGTIDKKFGVDYASNVVFGSSDFSVLYITARNRFLALPMKVQGIKPLCASDNLPNASK